jgi:hypothetical protein
MGLRLRMRASYSCAAFHPEVQVRNTFGTQLFARIRIRIQMPLTLQVICTALKTYGMILADNGGNLHLSGVRAVGVACVAI